MPVEDPTAYGLVHLDERHAVSDFVEKPSSDHIEGGAAGRRPAGRGGQDSILHTYTNLISAGAYVLEREILELIPAQRNVSIEREVWPLLIGNGLYGYPSESYWLDIGTPDRYLKGTFDIIEGNVRTAVAERLGSGYLAIDPDSSIEGRVIPPAVIERGAHVAPGAHVGSLVVLGEGAHVGPNSTVERAVIMNGAQIGAGCTLRDCIVAAGARIADGVQIVDGAVLGEGVTIGAHNTVACGARIFPGVTLPDEALKF